MARIAGDEEGLLTTTESILALPAVDRSAAPSGIAWLGNHESPLTVSSDVAGSVIVAARPGSLSAADWNGLFAAVDEGATAVIGPVRPVDQAALRALAERGIALELHLGLGWGWLGCYHWQPESELFAGLPAGGLGGEVYADVLPRYVLSGLGGEVLAGSFKGTEPTAHDPRFHWFSDVEVVARGRGPSDLLPVPDFRRTRPKSPGRADAGQPPPTGGGSAGMTATPIEVGIPAEIHAALAAVVGEANVSTGIADRMANARGVWPIALKQARQSITQGDHAGPPLPGCVVWPADTGEVSADPAHRAGGAGAGRPIRRRVRDRRWDRGHARLHLPRHQAARPAAHRSDLPGRPRPGRHLRHRPGAPPEPGRLLGGSVPAIALLKHRRRVGRDAGVRHIFHGARQHRGPRRWARSRPCRR